MSCFLIESEEFSYCYFNCDFHYYYCDYYFHWDYYLRWINPLINIIRNYLQNLHINIDFVQNKLLEIILIIIFHLFIHAVLIQERISISSLMLILFSHLREKKAKSLWDLCLLIVIGQKLEDCFYDCHWFIA